MTEKKASWDGKAILLRPDINTLKKAREEAGIPTQAAAARLLGTNIRTYQRWEAGERDIPYLALKCLELFKENKSLKSKITP